ncbi:DUF2721 domain-containing protein [Denitromonas ohlonensis]|jgi:hypothetical protein|uniref:DUF2721 domain-containing protein n=2 Tax=Denitromonas TaxID=139331 RepID=A0A557RS34_9RHOO|nr:DUF2721 domain-containing protein [Denitromonas ohlonensis]TVT47200.1 MAG: DUF2721 domain-containing protein [Denitromonas halophila]TVO67966.1 DUF2721 domain-containing protein [Denitromonas ohlonensis]TVO78129.1 DUF2721 domain-containing protein [Denitromonas ohlonensis]TVT66789.1 MAG: DUF2721 domain-containing protein [Denitromonas halophila]TVT68169.1 MAG: DUF2721 domain-containing protein [Denitromonas halophila]
MPEHLTDLSHAIQLAVAPVFLLTALATLINAMSGRLARVVDRRRVVRRRLQEKTAPDQKDALERELALLARRGTQIYQAIFCQVLSALLVCLVVAGAFVGTLVRVELTGTIATLFILAMLAMISGLGLFLREVYIAVRRPTHWEP